MTESESNGGTIVDLDAHHDDSNLGKWDRWYAILGLSGREQSYGDVTTYLMAASFLADCRAVEDWGCGMGGFSAFCRSEYIGVDGSRTPFAKKVVDLVTYRSQVDGILLRHVLEHNYNWPRILDAALASFTKKLCVVLFTPFADITRELAHNRARGVDAPDLSLSPAELEARLTGLQWTAFRDIATKTQYGREHLYCIWRDEGGDGGAAERP